MLSPKPTFTTVALLLVAAFTTAQDYEYEQPRSAPRAAPSFSGSSGPRPTPVPILKQINRHNEDGSYTYGYESADGTFKIETKLPTGEVKGKYGYLDDGGKVRVVEYGANRYGFQPAGEGITVAPPTLVDETTNKDGTLNSEFVDQGQYYEAAPAPRPAPRPRPQPQPQPQPQYEFSSPARPAPLPSRAQIPGASPVEIEYAPAPRFASRPPPAPVHSFRPAPRPAPVQEDIQYVEPAAPRPAPLPAPRPAPRPAPVFRPEPPQFAPAPRPGPQPTPGRGGVLDQLARDYALPQDSAAPLHDISFGYY